MPSESHLGTSRRPRFAPAREDGLKPWVVVRSEWGRKTTKIVYAETRASAEYQEKGRQLYVSAHGRRATPADMEAFA